jgi:hypothetical protein
MIEDACNLRYKNAYTSCYICHAKCKKYKKQSYTYAANELHHQLRKPTTNKGHTRPARRGEAKGLDTTRKREKERKNSQALPKHMH